MNQDRPTVKLTLEDLLRLKRAERPPAEFWTKFEQDLRAKQLAAIVAKRPWWDAVPAAFVKVARLRLPLGATAILAITVLATREYRTPSVDRPALEPAMVATAAPVIAAVEPRVELRIAETTPPPVQSDAIADAQLASNDEAAPVNPGEISEVISLLGAPSEHNDMPRTAARSARAIIDDNLARAKARDPELAAAVGGRNLEKRSLIARTNSEPLAQVKTPMGDRLSKYLTTSLPANYVIEATDLHPSPHANDVLGTRFSGSHFRGGDEVSRFGTYRGGDGAGVSIKL
jgi:hypothetical protein